MKSVHMRLRREALGDEKIFRDGVLVARLSAPLQGFSQLYLLEPKEEESAGLVMKALLTVSDDFWRRRPTMAGSSCGPFLYGTILVKIQV